MALGTTRPGSMSLMMPRTTSFRNECRILHKRRFCVSPCCWAMCRATVPGVKHLVDITVCPLPFEASCISGPALCAAGLAHTLSDRFNYLLLVAEHVVDEIMHLQPLPVLGRERADGTGTGAWGGLGSTDMLTNK